MGKSSSARWWIFYEYMWHYWPAAFWPERLSGWRGRYYRLPFLLLLCFRFRCATHDAIWVHKAMRFTCCCCYNCCFYNISIELAWQFQSIHSTKLYRVINFWQHSLIPQQRCEFSYEITEICRNTAKSKDWNYQRFTLSSPVTQRIYQIEHMWMITYIYTN